jgi:glyoxylase-like metal-dependent hydrolase (beta-lactamase superfamily II)
VIDKIKEVTAGKGGEAYLVTGSEKSALIDCGMAYCAPELIGNMREALGGRKLDFVFISHSHYDHIGAIPYLREEWPGLQVLGAKHAMDVMCRKNALKTIRQLSIMAGRYYGAAGEADYDDSLMKVDRAVREGDTFDLGGANVRVLETPGHTKCSLTFMINDEVMFASET